MTGPLSTLLAALRSLLERVLAVLTGGWSMPAPVGQVIDAGVWTVRAVLLLLVVTVLLLLVRMLRLMVDLARAACGGGDR